MRRSIISARPYAPINNSHLHKADLETVEGNEDSVDASRGRWKIRPEGVDCRSTIGSLVVRYCRASRRGDLNRLFMPVNARRYLPVVSWHCVVTLAPPRGCVTTLQADFISCLSSHYIITPTAAIGPLDRRLSPIDRHLHRQPLPPLLGDRRRERASYRLVSPPLILSAESNAHFRLRRFESRRQVRD